MLSQVPQKEKVSSNLTASGHFLQPVGKSLAIPARPVDMAFHPNGKWLYVKENNGLTVVDAVSLKVLQSLAVPGGSSYTGLLVSPDGSKVWFSNAGSAVQEGTIAGDGKVSWTRKLDLPKPKIGGEVYPTGMALSEDGKSLYVCASRANQIYRVDLGDGKVKDQFDTDIAPFDLAFNGDQSRLYVSCWGGKRPASGAKTAASSGTQVEVDDRGIVKGATVAVHDMASNKYISAMTGLQPSEIVVASDGRAFIANANHDTVTELSSDLRRTRSIVVKPDFNLPFGSAPSGLATDGDNLYVACGGNNALAVISLGKTPTLRGFLPTGWYPVAVAVRDSQIYVANVKGTGSRRRQKDGSFGVYDFTGTVQKIDKGELEKLKSHTATVNKLNATPTILKANEGEEEESVEAHKEELVPVPDRLGERSSIQHVVYVIKENRTYDQVFGDIKKGDGDPKLCVFGRKVTPNHHALAEQFVLLDNYYCNGVNSADGHAWSVEGNASSHFERSFGGWTRSYPFGDDPLSPSSSGFLWDNVLKWGKTFRNYGEFNYSEPTPKASWKQIYDDWKSGANKIKLTHNIGVERLRRYSKPNYPGWNMNIPDVLRAKIFVEDVKQFDKAGYFPNLTILYLPQDHTSGTTPGEPTPRATIADNDLALGQCVEALSKSRFWKKMAIFVIEDDPQNGFDHIDGHRSLCLVVSPFTQTGKVVSKFYNQTSVLHTMQRILGVPPMNQLDARAPLMADCFVNKPNLKPYKVKPNQIPIDELNPKRSALKGEALKWADISAKLPRTKPDMMDLEEATLFNRAIWFSQKGSRTYPIKWSGAHGRGLKRKGLAKTDENDED
jgi:DNA-binding beta-propeller fold protein YncE/phospholipase C